MPIHSKSLGGITVVNSSDRWRWMTEASRSDQNRGTSAFPTESMKTMFVSPFRSASSRRNCLRAPSPRLMNTTSRSRRRSAASTIVSSAWHLP